MDVHTYHRWQRIWIWWKETAEFKLESNWYRNIMEAPQDVEDGTRISVMGDVLTEYMRIKGKWEKLQEITEEDCRMLYGQD